MKKKAVSRVREPIQTYLAPSERAVLDRLATKLDLSRAEVLRRGLAALAGEVGRTDRHPFDDLVGAFDNPRAPRDLAENHDKYLAEDLEAKWHRPRRRRSS